MTTGNTDPAHAVDGDQLVVDIVDTITKFTDGKDVELNFLTHPAIEEFDKAIGIDRNWASLSLDEIAPTGDEGVNLVPESEASAVLEVLRTMLERKLITPEADGKSAPHLLNDFLPTGTDFEGAPCLGHSWEFRYALGVELEHGVTRGTNVTQNHPLLTGLVVMAHLSEDTLYYARLRVMETEGELFNAELAKDSAGVLDALERLGAARKDLADRQREKLTLATQGSLPDQASN